MNENKEGSKVHKWKKRMDRRVRLRKMKKVQSFDKWKMMCVNVNGWSESIKNEIQDICSQEDILMIAATEMKLPDGTQEDLEIQNYEKHPQLRVDGTGGLCVWIKATTSGSIKLHKPIYENMKFNSERIWTTFDLDNGSYAVCNLYMRVESPVESEKYQDNVMLLQQIQKESEELRQAGKKIMIWGDMNAHVQPNDRFQFETYTSHKQNNNGKLVENLAELLDLYCVNPLAQNPDKFPMYTYQRQMGENFHQSIIDYALVDAEYYTNIESFVIDSTGKYALSTDHATLVMEMNAPWTLDEKGDKKKSPLRIHDKIRFKEEVEENTKRIKENFQDHNVNLQHSLIREILIDAASEQKQTHTKRENRESRQQKKVRILINIKIKKIKIARRKGETNTMMLEKQLEKLRKQQSKLAWKAKYLLTRRLAKRISKNTPESSKLFWKCLQPSKKGKTDIKLLESGNNRISDVKGKNALIEDYFMRKFQATRTSNQETVIEDMTNIAEPTKRLNEKDQNNIAKLFDMNELEEAIKELKEGKAAGVDDITPSMLKHIGIEMKSLLLQLYNNIWRSGVVPKEWKEADVVLILKKPPATDIDQYRPIMLISNMCKLMTKMIAKRIGSAMEHSGILNDNQNGFRKGRRTTDNLFILQTLQEQSVKRNEKMFCLYVDIRAAYDSVSRPILYKKLNQYGFPSEFTEFLKDYYTGDNITSTCGGSRTSPMFLSRGVRQGCNLSSYLFILYLTEFCDRVEMEDIGAKLGDNQVGFLCFADDLVLIARSEKEVSRHLEILSKWCSDYKMSVSPTKTQLVGPETEGVWILTTDGLEEDMILEFAQSYNYLGVTQYKTLHKTLSDLSSEVMRKAEQFRALINLQRYTIIDSVKAYKTLWESVLLPSLLYSLDVVPIQIATIEKLELVQNRVGRTIMGLRSSTPSVAVNLELGMKPIWYKILVARIQYIKRMETVEKDRLIYQAYRYHKAQENTRFWTTTIELMEKLGIFNKSPEELEVTYAANQLERFLMEEVYSKQTLELVTEPKNWFRLQEGVSNHEWSKVFLQFKYMNAELGNRDSYFKGATPFTTADGRVFVCPLCNVGRNDEVHLIDQCLELEDFRKKVKYDSNKTLRQLLQSLRTKSHRDSLSVAKQFFGAGGQLGWKDIRRRGEILIKLRHEFLMKWAEKS